MYTNKLILLAILTLVSSLDLAVVEYPTDVSTMPQYQSLQTVPGDNPNATTSPSSPYESFNNLPGLEDNYTQTNDFYYGSYPYYYYSSPYSYYDTYPYYYPYNYRNQGHWGEHRGFHHRGHRLYEHRGGHFGGHGGHGGHGGGHGGGGHK